MPRTYSMARRDVARAAARQRILDAALDELVAAGEGLTMQSVAERADVALRTVYNHFPDREALLTAAFTHHFEQTREAVEAVDLPDAPPQEQLRHAVAAYFARYAAMGPRLAALLSLRGFPELDEQVHAIRGWRRGVLRKIIRRAARAGILAIPQEQALAVAFTMTSHASWAILLRELSDDDTKAARVATETLTSALFRARAR